MSKSNFYNLLTCAAYLAAILVVVVAFLYCTTSFRAHGQTNGTTIRLDPSAVDGNGDSRDDNWRVKGNIGTPQALYVPVVLIPETFIRCSYARWMSNNNGTGASEDFTRTFTLPANYDPLSVELGLEFSASNDVQVFVNGFALRAYSSTGAERTFAQYRGQTIYQAGQNEITFRVQGKDGRLLAFMFWEGYVNYLRAGEPSDRTLHDYRRKGRRDGTSR